MRLKFRIWNRLNFTVLTLLLLICGISIQGIFGGGEWGMLWDVLSAGLIAFFSRSSAVTLGGSGQWGT